MLSLFTLDTSALLDSKDVIPGESFEPVDAEYPGRWSLAFRMVQAWNFQGFPSASSVVPKTYANIGRHRGRLLEIAPDERGALLNLAVYPIDLQRMRLREQEICRMAVLIRNRKELSGTVSAERHPVRDAPPLADLKQLLLERWKEQQGRCALCGKLIPLPTDKKLLQCSPDRINSTNPSYAKDNVQITHLGCNWAKNDTTDDEFAEWLDMIRRNIDNTVVGSGHRRE